ncbi:MAG: YegS/Rv2252/BmrU family lipid kinase [Bacilli bacterium]|nr:YegS/Rv2252/BmrU family lipid kinase [Bacilli bacterium]
MKALLMVGTSAGKRWVPRHKEKVLRELRPCFDALDYYEIGEMEEAAAKAVEACESYDALLIAGGDGTFNHLINAIAPLEKLPIIGYINAGTLCDVGVNFGIKGGPKKAISIIKNGYTSPFDLVKINDSYFIYMAAIGAYSDIAYATKRTKVKRVGKVAYYEKAAVEAFKPVMVKVKITSDGKTSDVEAPFVMILNGRNVGGFKVNRDSRMDDGKVELFYSAKGWFNGLLHYFFRHKVTCLRGDRFEIEADGQEPWCLDGELGPSGPAKIEVLPKKLQIFCRKPRKVRK